MNRLNTKRPLVLCVMLACSTSAFADNLADVYQQAQLHDPVWSAARANYTANVERLPQGRAQLLPSLSLSASTSQSQQRVVTPMINDTFSYRTDVYSLQLTQPI